MELKGNVNSLPVHSGIEDLSSLPADPGCGKRSECMILKILYLKYIYPLTHNSLLFTSIFAPKLIILFFNLLRQIGRIVDLFQFYYLRIKNVWW